MRDGIDRAGGILPLAPAKAGTRLLSLHAQNRIPACRLRTPHVIGLRTGAASMGRRRVGGLSGMLALVALVVAASASPAAADFRLCNNTGSRVGVAIGYKDADGWTTEGWWNLPSRTCETVLKGNLVARYYYVYAIDYDHGGEWMGQAFMCTRDKEFTIRGIADCLARGYDRTGFFEVDTGEQRAWTVQLTESSEQAPQRPLSAGSPLTPAPPAATAPAGARPPAPPPPGSPSR
jgi:uncharacterized membrane protein